MPYIEVDELPEGTTAANVVSREDYDKLRKEMNDLEDQRDQFVKAIEEERKSAREARAKYAKAILDQRDASAEEAKKEEQDKGGADKSKHMRPMSIEELFS